MKPYMLSKMISFWKQTCDVACYISIFPIDAIILWFQRLLKGVFYVAKGQ